MAENAFTSFHRLSAWQSWFSFPGTRWHWDYTRVAGPGGIPGGMGLQPMHFHVLVVSGSYSGFAKPQAFRHNLQNP